MKKFWYSVDIFLASLKECGCPAEGGIPCFIYMQRRPFRHLYLGSHAEARSPQGQ